MNSTELARALQALRKTRRGGRPIVLKPCPKCGRQFSARKLRGHKPQCRVKIS